MLFETVCVSAKQRAASGTPASLQVLFGLLVHQTRANQATGHRRCHARFSRLDQGCPLQQPEPAATPLRVATPVVALSTDSSTNAYGSDPMFNPCSRLYNPHLSGRAASFFNTSAEAQEVSAVGMPHAFFPRPISGLPPGFPVAFEARSDFLATLHRHIQFEGRMHSLL